MLIVSLLGTSALVGVSTIASVTATAQQTQDKKDRPGVRQKAPPPGAAPRVQPGNPTAGPRQRPERTPRAATPATPPKSGGAPTVRSQPRVGTPATPPASGGPATIRRVAPGSGAPPPTTSQPVGKASPTFKTRPVVTPKATTPTAPVTGQPTTATPTDRRARPDGRTPPAAGGPGWAPPKGTAGFVPGKGPRRLDDLKKGRVERVEAGGRKVIVEPGNRVIIRQNNRIIVRRDEGQSFLRFAPGGRTRVVGNGVRETVIVRPGGIRVVSEVDANGRLLRRFRREASGREIVLIDNRRFYRNAAIGVGVAALGIGTALVLSRPAVALPREKYIVDYQRASDDDLYEALTAPPVARLERGYSLEEIRFSEPLREHMRRIDLDTINFEFGSFEVTPDQYPKLERLARIINRVLQRNAAEVFLIEGHTDAVGTPEDNATLSDRRAEAVVDILVSQFSIPPENLVTQGYGEQHLKVPTEGPERLNRRVAVRRITPLLGGKTQ